MSPSELLDKYLDEKHMMQLATSAGDQPWCCTVYYVHDEDRNLYWASMEHRRHSQEIEVNDKVAVAIPVHHVKGEKVVGIQIQGTAKKLLSEDEIRPIAKLYAEKFGRDHAWVDRAAVGETIHKLYKLTPSSIVLFDERNFDGNPQQKIL